MTNYLDSSDQEIFDLLQSGDQLALDEIFRRYHLVLYNHAFRRLPDREEVRDIIQELFVYLWENRGTLNLSTSLAGYLYASVRNRVMSHYRHRKVRDNFVASLDEFIGAGENLIEANLDERELVSLIEREVSAFTPQMRLVFDMSRNQNMSHNEIALALNLSPHTVRNHVHNALKVLRNKLGMPVLLSLF